jgi:histidinol-phosphate aminotransferase
MSDYPRPTRQIRDVPATTPFVAPEELARRVGRSSLVRLGANESAFGPSPRAIAAMREQAAQASWYGDPEAFELRTALAARHGCGIENIVIGAGIDDLLGLIVRTYAAPGDIALMSHGSYATFTYHVIGYGLTLSTVPPFDDGSIDVDALGAAARERAPKIVYLANPDNPSGTFAGRDAVARLRATVPDETLFVLDEAYADFVAPGALIDDEIDPRMIRLRTFSKAHGLAGARIAYAIGSSDAIATFQKIRLHFGVNRMALAGALASLSDPEYIAEVVAEVARGRDDYRALATQLGLRTLPSQTNFVTLEVGSRAQADAMVAGLLERGVFVRKPGAPPIDGFIRVTVGTPLERAAFADAFTAVLDTLRERVG